MPRHVITKISLSGYRGKALPWCSPSTSVPRRTPGGRFSSRDHSERGGTRHAAGQRPAFQASFPLQPFTALLLLGLCFSFPLPPPLIRYKQFSPPGFSAVLRGIQFRTASIFGDGLQYSKIFSRVAGRHDAVRQHDKRLDFLHLIRIRHADHTYWTVPIHSRR